MKYECPEYACPQLAPIEPHYLNANPSEWPAFISTFENRVHNNISFDDNMRIIGVERLISVLEGEAKRSVESNGCNGILYVTALKSLKRDFGNSALVLH